MSRLVVVVGKGISAFSSIKKSIVNYISKPKNKPNDKVISKSNSYLAEYEKEQSKKRKVPEELYQTHVMGTFMKGEAEGMVPKGNVHFSESDKGPTNIQLQTHIDGVEFNVLLDNSRRSIESASNYSINRQLSYKKNKTQQRNWSKWKRGNR